MRRRCRRMMTPLSPPPAHDTSRASLLPRGRVIRRLAALACIMAVAVGGALAGATTGATETVATGDPVAAAPQGPLADTPWLAPGDGGRRMATEPARRALRFPAGVDYAQALERLFVSAMEDGTLPADAVLVDPLPPGVVLRRGVDGIAVSLTAPWGYDASTGAIRLPSYALPGRLAPDEVRRAIREARATGRALPLGAEIDVPVLPSCQTQDGPAPPAACPAMEVAP